MGQTVRKLGIYGLLPSRLQLIHIGKSICLEYPVPVQLLSHSGTGLVCSHNWSTLYSLPYLLVCIVGLDTVSLKYILYGSLAHFLSTQICYELCYSLERNALHNVQITDKRTDVVIVLDAAVGCVAVVHATTLADLLVILFLGSLYDKLDVYDLCLTDFPVLNAIQWATAAFAVGRLMLYDSIWRTNRLQGASLVSELSTAWLAQGLSPAKFACDNALLGWRNAAVAACLLWLFR